MLDFENLVKTRQSCRDFNDKPLEKDVVEQIVSLATLAPSACNSQPWKMICVTDESKLDAVAKSLQDRGMNKFTDKAKAFIVLVEKQATLKERVSVKFNRNHFVKYDIGQLCAYITLTAKYKGVESCIIGWINQDALRNAVNYGEDEESNIVIALGYSDCEIRDKIRKDKDQVITIL